MKITMKNLSLLFGKYKVGEIIWDGCTSKNDPLKFKVSCILPGIKTYLGHYATEEEAKELLTKVATKWLDEANLQFKE